MTYVIYTVSIRRMTRTERPPSARRRLRLIAESVRAQRAAVQLCDAFSGADWDPSAQSTWVTWKMGSLEMTRRWLKCFVPQAVWLLVLLTGAAVAATGPIAFNSGSLQKILDAHAGESFVLVLWSLHCIPCREEMDLLAAMRDEHPELDLVFVSTDGMGRADQIMTVLAHHGLEDAESWAFAGPVQRLRYQIDPNWYGVLPRSYFYDASHTRFAVSGALEREQVLAWLEYLASDQQPSERGLSCGE